MEQAAPCRSQTGPRSRTAPASAAGTARRRPGRSRPGVLGVTGTAAPEAASRVGRCAGLHLGLGRQRRLLNWPASAEDPPRIDAEEPCGGDRDQDTDDAEAHAATATRAPATKIPRRCRCGGCDRARMAASPGTAADGSRPVSARSTRLGAPASRAAFGTPMRAWRTVVGSPVRGWKLGTTRPGPRLAVGECQPQPTRTERLRGANGLDLRRRGVRLEALARARRHLVVQPKECSGRGAVRSSSTRPQQWLAKHQQRLHAGETNRNASRCSWWQSGCNRAELFGPSVVAAASSSASASNRGERCDVMRRQVSSRDGDRRQKPGPSPPRLGGGFIMRVVASVARSHQTRAGIRRCQPRGLLQFWSPRNQRRHVNPRARGRSPRPSALPLHQRRHARHVSWLRAGIRRRSPAPVTSDGRQWDLLQILQIAGWRRSCARHPAAGSKRRHYDLRHASRRDPRVHRHQTRGVQAPRPAAQSHHRRMADVDQVARASRRLLQRP